VVGRFVIDCGLGTTRRRLRIEILAGFKAYMVREEVIRSF
jgi:hypothetical protein